ncbi:Galactose oxidase/kelch repeat superfamily protein [Euphorbia peplus]|nr:Galactose oxidase/kelch repeat superfamily protein [Euphorbia peplus]
MLRPSRVHFGFLIACDKMLVLGGICRGTRGPSFNLWRVDEKTMEFSLILIMSKHLLYGLVDSDEDDKFASLKCIGMGNLVYVINEDYHMKYPACICEIVDDESGKCRWREVSELPSHVNKFHKIVNKFWNISVKFWNIFEQFWNIR